jgi:hypothetical protein
MRGRRRTLLDRKTSLNVRPSVLYFNVHCLTHPGVQKVSSSHHTPPVRKHDSRRSMHAYTHMRRPGPPAPSPQPACSNSAYSAEPELSGSRAHVHARSRKTALRVLQFSQVKHARSGLSGYTCRRLRASTDARAAPCSPDGTQGTHAEI